MKTIKTKLQTELAKILPFVVILTHWQHDTDMCEKCEWMEDEDPNDWQAWQSEVRATAIEEGEKLGGSAYLGGIWEQAEDLPEVSNPEISGYEAQMTIEALEELAKKITSPDQRAQINSAIAFIKRQN